MTVQIVEFEEWHHTHIHTWLKGRDLDAKSFLQNLPRIGFVALKEFVPVACCFLRECEGGYGIIEGLATDPTANSADRHHGIEGCVQSAIEAAKSSKFTHIISWSKDAGTLERSLSHGFRLTENLVIVKEL